MFDIQVHKDQQVPRERRVSINGAVPLNLNLWRIYSVEYYFEFFRFLCPMNVATPIDGIDTKEQKI